MPADVRAGDGLGLEPGLLPGPWQTGGPNCVSVPDWQVHAYTKDFYILRESGCIHFEKPLLVADLRTRQGPARRHRRGQCANCA